jgi:uncharacterized protein (TIGR00251 family)
LGEAVPWSPVPGGLALAVRLTPKSSRDALEAPETLSDGRVVLKARVRAVPEDGKANEALLRLVAKALGISFRDVGLVSGATSRLKTLRIAGDSVALVRALETVTASKG